MIVRFCLYSILKNLRFAAPFLAIYLLEAGYTYAEIGSMLGCQHLVTAVLEIPSGVGADRWGRRRVLAGSFSCHAIGLAILALAAQGIAAPAAIWFYAGLAVYGIGEALRTGSHKAIMLDYLETTGQADQATSVLAFTRMFSKTSSALAGLAAGAILFFSHGYTTLFWLSAAAAGGGVLLTLSYPRYLEGELHRHRTTAPDARVERESKLTVLLHNAGMWPLVICSVVYESQVEVMLKLFLQPFLYVGLGALGIPVVAGAGATATSGTGSLAVGINELFRDGLGAVGARGSARLERAVANRRRALVLVYLVTAGLVLTMALFALDVEAWLLPGLAAIGLITMLQNLRRPMYVSELNDAANKPLRATILSIDNQAISFSVAVLMPLLGLAADRWGLWSICAISSALMALGLAVRRPAVTTA